MASVAVAVAGTVSLAVIEGVTVFIVLQALDYVKEHHKEFTEEELLALGKELKAKIKGDLIKFYHGPSSGKSGSGGGGARS